MRLSMIKRMVKVWTLSRVVLYHSFAPRGMNVSWLLHHLFLQSALCIILSSTNGQKKGQKSQIYCFASARDCRRWTIIPSLLAISNPFNFPLNIISCNSHFFQFPIKDTWIHIFFAQKSNYQLLMKYSQSAQKNRELQGSYCIFDHIYRFVCL